ncbi:MAG: hypothetical protein FJX74_13775 [Armatimonadetes bacterium]|nr:hypothetical protein [Armatimonadota bacterium]
MVGITIDGKTGELYITCDGCGKRIFGQVKVWPPAGARDWDRYTHVSWELCEREEERRGGWRGFAVGNANEELTDRVEADSGRESSRPDGPGRVP